MSQARYRIQVVAQRTQTPTATLRAWERRYGVPQPSRGGADYRLYSERDISEVLELKRLCEEGLSASEAAAVVLGARAVVSRELQGVEVQGAEGKGADGQGAEGQGAEGRGAEGLEEEPSPFCALRARLLESIRAFDVRALERHVRRALLLGSAHEVFDEIFAPTLSAVGEEWHAGSLSIAQEHLATELLGNATRDLLRAIQPPEGSPCALLACVQDEQHALPLYGSAFHFVGLGYRVVILGVNTPPEALTQPVLLLAPAVVGLSVTQAREGLGALMPRYALACAGTPWVVGGAGAAAVAGPVAAAGGRVVLGGPGGVRAALVGALSSPARG